MIFLYFEDWSEYTWMLDQKGIKHGKEIIKVFASPIDPRIKFNNDQIKVVEIDDSSLSELQFEYKDRGIFDGHDLEKELGGLPDFAARSARGLFRFANKEDLSLCQTGMGIRKEDGTYLIESPMEDIDSLDMARNIPDKRAATVHLDIFVEESLERLQNFMDISPSSNELLSRKMGTELRSSIQAEINANGIERR